MLNIENIYNNTLSELKLNIDLFATNEDLYNVYQYALLPAGKLFRPLIFKLYYYDLLRINPNSELQNKNLSFISSAIEVHHVYTLLHDDLPAMDNDDYRRGKLSVHKKYNQWTAILAGDGLLNSSYFLLSKCNRKYIPDLLKIFSHLLGPKGLIRGQYLDLSGKIKLSSEMVIETHFLKTSRLIQVALISSLVISDKYNYHHLKQTLKLGRSLGINFQLIDDLLELTSKLEKHELEINPWINDPKKTLRTFLNQMNILKNIFTNLNLVHLKNYIYSVYFTKSKIKIEKNYGKISIYYKNLNPIVDILGII